MQTGDNWGCLGQHWLTSADGNWETKHFLPSQMLSYHPQSGRSWTRCFPDLSDPAGRLFLCGAPACCSYNRCIFIDIALTGEKCAYSAAILVQGKRCCLRTSTNIKVELFAEFGNNVQTVCFVESFTPVDVPGCLSIFLKS